MRPLRMALVAMSLVSLLVALAALLAALAGCAPATGLSSQPAVIMVSSDEPATALTQTIQARDPSTGALRWTYTATGAFFTPAIGGGLVVAPSATLGSKPGDTPTGALTALRERDGHALWTAHLDGAPSGSPIVVDGVVYISALWLTSDKQSFTAFYALRADTGKQLWRVDIANTAGSGAATTATLGVFQSFQVANGALIVTSNPSCEAICLDEFVLALRASDGKLLWKTALHGNQPIQQPVIAGDGLYLREPPVYDEATNTTGAPHLLDISASGGSIHWSVQAGQEGPLFVSGGALYTSTRTQDDPTRSDSPYTVGVAALDAATGATRWRYTIAGGSPFIPPPLLAVGADTVYIEDAASHATGSTTYTLAGLDPATGATRWRTPLSRPLDTVALAGGTLYTLTALYPVDNLPVNLEAFSSSGGAGWTAHLSPTPTGSTAIAYLALSGDHVIAAYGSNTVYSFAAQGSHTQEWTATAPGRLLSVTVTS